MSATFDEDDPELSPEARAEYQRLRIKLGLADEARDEGDAVGLALLEVGVSVDAAIGPAQGAHLERMRELIRRGGR
jgi:hypothetical protein